MKLAQQEGAIDIIPATPRTKRKDNPRSFFRFYPLVEKDGDEYKLLLHHSKSDGERKGPCSGDNHYR